MTDAVLGIKAGDKASFTKTVSEEDINDFARVTGDKNPVHLDADYAAKTRFKQRIAHGMLSAGFISAALGTKLVSPSAAVIYVAQTMRFLRPVLIGDTITAQVEVKEVDAKRSLLTVATDCLNQKGEKIVTGEATVLLDPVSA